MRRRSPAVAVLVLCLSLIVPVALWAHAALVRSAPGANAKLEKAPTELRLWFSEAPEVRLTTVTLTDSVGGAVPLGPVARGETKLSLVLAIPAPLSMGKYTVHWTTAAADGHPSSGSYSFTVLRAASSPVAAPDSVALAPITRPAAKTDAEMTDPSAETLPYIATRAINFAALLVVIGVVVFRWAILRRIGDAELMARITPSLASFGIATAALLLVSCVIKLGLQASMMARMTHVGLGPLITQTAWGQAWLLQCLGALAIVGMFFWARGGRTGTWIGAAIVAVLLAFSPGLGGHAVTIPGYLAMSVGFDALHVLSAGGWLGSVLCMVAVAGPVITRSQSPGRLGDVAKVVNALSPVALTCAGLLVFSGVINAKFRLGTWGAIATSDYGRVLLIKLAVICGVLVTGAYNYLRVRPSLGTESATATLRKVATTEVVIGILVVVVTAVLVATPMPSAP